MAVLDALASPADLSARNITVPDGVDVSTLLDAASAAVRDAAGCAISNATSTVTLVVTDRYEIRLPAGPVQSVASVTVDGEAVTGWQKIGDDLFMPYGWTDCLPVEVTVTYTHGLTVIPKDIVDLVCGMVAMAADDGYGSAGYRQSTRLGEFSESFSRPAGALSPSPLALPDGVRDRLRARFGTGVAVLRVAR